MADLLSFMMFAADARQTDEGRSAFSKKGGGSRVGELMFDEKVQIYSDPDHPLAPTLKFAMFSLPSDQGLPIGEARLGGEGCAQGPQVYAVLGPEDGQGAVPLPSNFIMEGGTATMADLISGTERGLLVTRFWYVRMLDPQALMITGLTRDGLFLIEKGKVTRPVKNLRWNESPIVAFNNIDAMTPAERAGRGRQPVLARLPRRPDPGVHVHELVGCDIGVWRQRRGRRERS